MRISDWSSDVCSSDLRKRINAALSLGFGPERDDPLTERIGPGHRFLRGEIHTDDRRLPPQPIAAVPGEEISEGTARAADMLRRDLDHELVADRKSTRLNSSH